MTLFFSFCILQYPQQNFTLTACPVFGAHYNFLDDKIVSTGIDVHQDFVNEKHLGILKDLKIQKGSGIFILSDVEKINLNLQENENSVIRPYYTTEQLQRYYANPNNSYWIIYTDINIRKSINEYPNIKKHLYKYKKVITSDFAPYGLHRARDQVFFEGEKIISLRKTLKPAFTYSDFPCYVSQTYFVIQPKDIDYKYLSGILNSKLVYFWLYYKGKKQGEQLQIDKEPLLDIPLIKIESSQKEALIKLVEQMLSAQKELHHAKTGKDKDYYERRCRELDSQIDRLVYELYGLTEEEIRIVEGVRDD
ncbi:MAG: hypothetical protein HPY53_16285 [Brevinematales bacterium]|nr:hypothetical protein [Brevinematales bacterium]